MDLQLYIQIESINFVAPVIYEKNGFNYNDTVMLDSLASKILRAINESEKRFGVKPRQMAGARRCSEDQKLDNEHNISVYNFKDKIDKQQAALGCLKDRRPENGLPDSNVNLDSHLFVFFKIANNFNIQDKNGISPLMEAAGNKSLNDVNALLLKGAPVDRQDKQGNTALSWVIKSLNLLQNDEQVKDKLAIINTLLDNGANVDLPGTAGFTPLMYTVAINNAEAFKRAFKKGPNYELKNDAGETALQMAIKNNATEEIYTSLMRASYKNKQVDKNGHTPFMVASFRGRQDRMKSLLLKNADINIQDTQGWTALMHAVNCDDAETVEFLLKEGADPNIKNYCDKSAVALAYEQGKKQIAWMIFTASKNIAEDK